MSVENLAPLLVIGESTGTIALESTRDFQAVIASMVDQAKQSVQIYSSELDHDLYDAPVVVEAISRLARKNQISRIRILINDISKVQRLGHRLLELGRRLPSSIEFRKINSEYGDANLEYMVVDEMGLVQRSRVSAMRGTACFKAIPEGQRKARQFIEVWEHSNDDPALRRLYL